MVVALLLWTFGERLAPRWRFLLWGYVVLTLGYCSARFPHQAVPGAISSHIVHWSQEMSADLAPHPEAAAAVYPIPPKSVVIKPSTESLVDSIPVIDLRRETNFEGAGTPENSALVSAGSATSWQATMTSLLDANLVMRVLPVIWLLGVLALALKLLATVFVLRRRLSACRLVTDVSILEILETARRRMGLRRTPQLLVTPECLSPCVVGTWSPRIVLPEAMVTHSTTERLRHVLAHELAHLVRGDLWTNWLLLSARTLHWFNPVAWWLVREMQAEREAACDERALAAFAEVDRSAYAATIVELVAGLSPSAIAPGLIGLFSSTCRLKARLERLVRSPSVATLRPPIATGLLLGMILLGLTDSMPAVIAQAARNAETDERAGGGRNRDGVGRLCGDRHGDRQRHRSAGRGSNSEARGIDKWQSSSSHVRTPKAPFASRWLKETTIFSSKRRIASVWR